MKSSHQDGQPLAFDIARLQSHLVTLLKDIPAGQRRVLAIAGPPAAGKSFIADQVVAYLNEHCAAGCTALLPMDGFHFDDELLERQGLRQRKGAEFTFDVAGLRSTLGRLVENREPSVVVPRFDREIEIARAGAISIDRHARLIICEGNWLLLDQEPWRSLLDYFDYRAMVVVDPVRLEERNRDRWVQAGMSEDAIEQKLQDNDMPNVRLVISGSVAPDWTISN